MPCTNWTVEQSTKVSVCLAKILLSPMFAKAERQQRFLRYLVEEMLAGRVEKLKGYTIGLEVFDRDPSFEPAIDAIVRVEAARLRSKLREYYDDEGRTDAIRFELPKGNYEIHIKWREDALLQSPSGTLPQLIEDRPSLAVLPFTNISNDAEQGYFADGITECLITEISRLEGIFVISRHSSFIYKGVSKRAEEIGKELGVRYLLEGSVQRSGNSVRITAQLIDTASGAHVWADRYDRELKDIFAVQDEVTHSIATILHIKLTAREGNQYGGTSSMEAHDSLLRGLERLWLYEKTSTEQAQKHFERAVVLDPGYATAHVWLARSLMARWIFLWVDGNEMIERAYEHVKLALEIDPRLPLAYAVLSWVQRWRKQKDAAIEAGRRAVAMDPNNADAHLFLSLTLSAANLGEESLRYIETGMRLNPHPSTLYQFALGTSHMVSENYGEALQAFKRGTELSESFLSNHSFLCMIYTLQGRDDDARIEREKTLALSGGHKPLTRSVWLDDDFAKRFRELAQRAGLT